MLLQDQGGKDWKAKRVMAAPLHSMGRVARKRRNECEAFEMDVLERLQVSRSRRAGGFWCLGGFF